MPLKDIQNRLEERFSAPLSDFYERRIIFWKDEEREFESVFDKLKIPGVRKVKLTGTNSFKVKKLLSADDLTASYLVYSPLSFERKEDNWLLNIELYSEEFRSDLTSMRMTSLGVDDTEMMRKTVKLYSRFFDSKQLESKFLHLGNRYDTPTQFHLDVMAVLAGSSAGTIGGILQKLFSEELEADINPVVQSITDYGSLEAFSQMISKYTGYPAYETLDLSEIAAFILISALALNFDSSALRGLESYIAGTKNANNYSVVHEWMADGDKKAYFDLARQIEWKLNLQSRFEKADTEALLSSDVFPAIDEALLKRMFEALCVPATKENVSEMLGAVESKRTQGWFEEFKPFYDVLYYGAKMRDFYLKYNNGFHFTRPADLWEFYEQEAYRMDTYYRKFQMAYQEALQENNEYLEDSLRSSADSIENLYHYWFLDKLMENWVDETERDFTELGYISNIPRQKDFYENLIRRKSKRDAKRSVVIISDALRYEVGAELRDLLAMSTNGVAELTSRQSVFPSITKFGMTALLNWYKPSIQLGNDSKPEVLLHGMHVRSTAEREKRLQTLDGELVLKAGAIQADDFKAMKSKERRAYLKEKDTIYIYHNRIDKVGHNGPTEAFPAAEKAIRELQALVKTLINDNVTEIFITADHGFLYTAEPLQEMNKIGRSVLSAEALEYGRRYILAPEGTTAEYLLPVKMEEYDGEQLIGFTPRDTSRIKISGGKDNYVHGGISLQEMVVPVIKFNNKRSGKNKDYQETENARIQLLTENHKISNLMFNLSFYQPVPIGDKILPSVYKIRMEDEDGKAVSDEKTIIADFDSPENIHRQTKVRFTLKDQPYDKHKTYKLVISNGIDIPVEENFTIDIAMADDFGFDF